MGQRAGRNRGRGHDRAVVPGEGEPRMPHLPGAVLLPGASRRRAGDPMRQALSTSGVASTPRVPGRTPHSASRRAFGTTMRGPPGPSAREGGQVMSTLDQVPGAAAEPQEPGRIRYSPAHLARLLGLAEPTAEQAAVISAPMEPLSVIAGAGSGKSETMAARLVWLVANGMVRPERVLGLTFTRKAAAELGQR